MFRFAKIALGAAALASLGAVAYAAKDAPLGDNTVQQAKISMAQAVGIAEAHASGKAVRAEYEHEKTGWAYDIEIRGASKAMNVRVDADQGTVIAATDAKSEDDDQNEHGDEQD